MNPTLRTFLPSLAAAGLVVGLSSLLGGQAQAAPPFCTGTTMTVTSGQSVPGSFLLTGTSSSGNCVEAGGKIFGAFSVNGAITGAGSSVFTFTMTPGDVTIGFQGSIAASLTGGVDYTVAIDPALSNGSLINDLQKDFTLNSNPPGLPATATLTGTVNPGAVGFSCFRDVNITPSATTCPQTHTFTPVAQITVTETITTGTNAIVTAITDTISQTAPASLLSDSEQPGSVIVYPKFVNELFGGGSPIIVDGVAVPQTEIEIGAVCPPAFIAGGGFCPEHQPIKIRFHWVCPGTEGMNSNICPEEDFEVNITVPGKLAFSANGLPINTNSPPLVPAPPCARGYLIGWVINPANDLPIKFDGLIGNAVIRNPNLVAGPHAGMSTGLSAYNAIAIPADPALANLAPIANQPGPLLFDGAPGHYTAVTGVQIGDVRFDKMAAGSPPPNILGKTNLNFLTLDIRSNAPNSPTFVNLNFWNESLGSAVGSTNPAFEHLTSTAVEFVCWTQVPLSALGGGSLTQAFQGTRSGVVIAGPAGKIADGHAPGDLPGPATLIGLVETVEGTAANGFLERKYNFNMSTDGVPVSTAFVP